MRGKVAITACRQEYVKYYSSVLVSSNSSIVIDSLSLAPEHLAFSSNLPKRQKSSPTSNSTLDLYSKDRKTQNSSEQIRMPLLVLVETLAILYFLGGA